MTYSCLTDRAGLWPVEDDKVAHLYIEGCLDEVKKPSMERNDHDAGAARTVFKVMLEKTVREVS